LMVFLINFRVVKSLFQPNAVIKNLSFVVGEIATLSVPTPISKNSADKTPPNLKVYSDGFLVREAIEESWDTEGEIIFGNEFIKIGSEQNTNLWNQNYISQTINNLPHLKNIGFEYKLESLEGLAGFDELAFGVSVNNQLLFYAGAENKGDWRRVVLDLSQFESEILELKFLAGNSGDSLNPSWVELKNISTNWIVSNDIDRVIFEASDNSDLPVMITEEEIGDKKIILVKDLAGNTNKQSFNYLLDDQAPELITGFGFEKEPNNEVRLEFIAPLENQTLTRYYFYDLNGNLLSEKPIQFFNLIFPPNNFTGLEDRVLENIDEKITKIKMVSFDAALNRSEMIIDLF